MKTLLVQAIEAGDVLEVLVDEEWVTALVLLANEDAVILDLCDDSTPVVLRTDELGDYRIFEADSV